MRLAVLMAPVGLAMSATACGELFDDLYGANACQHGGLSYDAGESFPAGDGCNDCFCEADGNASCTVMVCRKACSEPAVYQEPGCAPPQGATVIEAACYVSCEGTPCDEGTCQLAHVNPCLCSGEEVCCDACGADEWFCLDTTPTACIDIHDGPLLTGSGRSYEVCGAGDCLFGLEIAATNDCAEVSMSICSGTAECHRENRGTLTAMGQMNAAGLAVELSGVELKSDYRCQECDYNDHDMYWVFLRFDGEEQKVLYDHYQSPAVLEKVDAFQRDLIDALDSCTSTANITVASDCQPKQS